MREFEEFIVEELENLTDQEILALTDQDLLELYRPLPPSDDSYDFCKDGSYCVVCFHGFGNKERVLKKASLSCLKCKLPFCRYCFDKHHKVIIDCSYFVWTSE